MASCMVCRRTILAQHLIDGDFCPDCWEDEKDV